MDAGSIIVSVASGAVSLVVGIVGHLLNRSIKAMDESIQSLRKDVSGQGDRLARLEERTEGRHQNTAALLSEHGNRIARLEDRPSGEKRRRQ